MSSKQGPPLTPADAVYLGLARIVGAEAAPVEARHLLRWPSRSRPGKEHFSSCDERGQEVRCTCEAWTYRGACGHAAGHLDALAHFGVTFGSPPADPGGAPNCPDCGRPCELRDMDDGDPADVWRWTCDRCETAWPPTRLPVPPAGAAAAGPGFATPLDPDDEGPFVGGAALDAAQAALGVEHDDWRTIGPPALDRLLERLGNPWLVSRGHAGVHLTCVTCHRIRRFASDGAACWHIAGGWRCECGGGGPTPPARPRIGRGARSTPRPPTGSSAAS